MFKFPHIPVSYEQRPERQDVLSGRLENAWHLILGKLKRLGLEGGGVESLVARINKRSPEYAAYSDKGLKNEVAELRKNLLFEGLSPENVIKSFSLIREYSRRVLQMHHYESQLAGGLILLKGNVAEMETGEGKTLTATLAAATVALANIPVHVISVNDYLTRRDHENMRPLYKALGLKTGCVTHDVGTNQRKQEYLADITYVTNKELVFDYLRDRLTLGEKLDPLLLQNEFLHGHTRRSEELLLRGLHYAIVDEADSILIDEARTPLIISGSQGIDEERQFLEQALDIAAGLSEDEDYVLDRAVRRLQLTSAGRQRVEREAGAHGPLWNGMVRRESTIQQALTALHLFHPDEQYLIRDGKVQIIDEFTGRVMEGRSWEQGLHQLIELKEGCELTERRETMAKISYQRFFRRYLRLAGMTGTAKEVADEIWSVYRMPTVKVPTHKPVQRKQLPTTIFPDAEQKWSLVVERVNAYHKQGRPVLVGTRSVAASEKLSKLVEEAGVAHQVLNAKQDAREAEVVSRAGNRNTVTIATNMAGRGTDIMLGRGVRELEGLHVIATELHEAARIDRQLAGRCGRQGDPGSFESILSFEDILFDGRHGNLLVRAGKAAATGKPINRFSMAGWLMKYWQKKVERYHARVRKELFRQDQAQGNLLSFAGRVE